MLQDAFLELSKKLFTNRHANEEILLSLSAEESDFCRFNKAKIRQIGGVKQHYLTMRLVNSKRHLQSTLCLDFNAGNLVTVCLEELAVLRRDLASLPEDPYFIFNESPTQSSVVGKNALPGFHAMVESSCQAFAGEDAVGFLADGINYEGFASSHGSCHWFENRSFSLDWSLYLGGDKAVKNAYAGQEFSAAALGQKVRADKERLRILAYQEKKLAKGRYAAYFTPSAMEEFFSLLSWNAFSSKKFELKQSPLQKMRSPGLELSPAFCLMQKNSAGFRPSFDDLGYVFTEDVPLIHEGKLRNTMTSFRTSKEYNLTANAMEESPSALWMEGGTLREDEILKKLGTGMYISNLWYLNYSDIGSAGITGMTRFASFWVENGKIVAPLGVMRFDDSFLSMFGKERLLGLSEVSEAIQSTSTYEGRSLDRMTLPGALVSDFQLVL